jgi:hypothetical protein
MRVVWAWLLDFGDFIVALLKHWQAMLTGSIATAALFVAFGVLPDFKINPQYFIAVFVFGGLFLAAFAAWREQRQKAREANQANATLQAQLDRRAALKAARAKLSGFLDEGKAILDHAVKPPIIEPPPEEERLAWVQKVAGYLRGNPDLDASFLARFLNHPVQPVVKFRYAPMANEQFGNTMNGWLCALRLLIDELKPPPG